MAQPRTNQKRKPMRPLRTKRANYSDEFVMALNYKRASELRKFITDRGKILSRRNSGLTAKQQRHVAEQVKIARYMGLLHYTADHLRISQGG